MQDILKYIDSQKKKLTVLTKELVSIPTVNPPGKNYRVFVKILENKLKNLGLSTRKVIIPKALLKKHKIAGNEDRICLIANWNVGAKKTLHVNGHYDVVPVSSNWKSEPFKPVIKGNKIFARGTEDMKGNIACYLTALFAIKALGHKPKINLEFSFTPDEETGGDTGFGYLIKKGLIKADFGIGEGCSGNYLSYGNKGVMWFRVDIKGKPAHASKPYKGTNAFEAMAKVSNKMMELNKKISKRKTAFSTRDSKDRFSTMVLGGECWGGDKTNIVPGNTSFSIDRRFLPEEDIKKVKKEIIECISKTGRAMKDLNIKTSVLVEQNSTVCNFKNRLTEAFSKAITEILGQSARTVIMAGATDMRFLMQRGIPCVGYSAEGGGRCHADDEYIFINSLVKTSKIFAYVFTNFSAEGGSAYGGKFKE